MKKWKQQRNMEEKSSKDKSSIEFLQWKKCWQTMEKQWQFQREMNREENNEENNDERNGL